MSGYNIKSSAIKISGVSQNVYISDIPDTNRITGSLFAFTVPNVASTTPTIIRRNIGVIDYKKGVITLNPINIVSGKMKDGQAILELSVCPASNDVV